MSTHVLDTAEKICDRFLLILEGKLIADGNMEAIRSLSGMPGASLHECFYSLALGED